MANTLEESLRSILDQLDDRFEVLVVDDGSTDGSQKILDNLEDEYDIFRWIEGENENIGEARAQANNEAKGDYILMQLDTDDKYEPVIEDFVKIFVQLDGKISGDFFFSANGTNIASKSLMLNIPYRSLGYGEDRDLWRRLKSEDKIISIDNKPLAHSLGYDRGKMDKIKVSMKRTVNEFRSGISLITYYRRVWRKNKVFEDYLKLPILPLLFLIAIYKCRNRPPTNYNELNSFDELRDGVTLSEIESRYSIEIDWSEISDQGKKIFNL